ncbi:MAG: 2-hydroxyacyl-CoA dehydratase family protein [Desulfobacteraceae bacterium]|jgi:benzoyl-CoA reductase/2-hydroxyglutaryl-CoA dehydratase subunit BcrC/BadD/HgdB
MRHEDTRITLLKKMVRSSLTYRLLRPLLDLLHRKNDNEPFKVWVRFLLDMTQKAYARKQPVIWMNAFAPIEIAYGLRAVPFIPEIVASLVAYLGQSKRPLALADSHISTDLCSFLRCALGLVLEGYLPPPDLIISSSYLCDGANKFFQYLSEIYGRPHLMLDPPHDDGPDAQRYMVDQLKDVVEKSCEILDQPMDQGRLSQSLNLSNRARSYMEEINRLRRSRPSPLPGSDGLSYVLGMGFYAVGSRWGVQFFRTLYHDLEKKVAEGHGYLSQEKYRLLWLHHIRPYYRNEIFQLLAERDVAVSFEEANYLYWPTLDPSQPWESLADKMLSNVWAGPLKRRIASIGEMQEDYHIDGVIHFSHWGCRQSCGGAGIIGDWLKQRGIPYLILPGDGADPDNYSPGQTRTRLEAWVEMLG